MFTMDAFLNVCSLQEKRGRGVGKLPTPRRGRPPTDTQLSIGQLNNLISGQCVYRKAIYI